MPLPRRTRSKRSSNSAHGERRSAPPTDIRRATSSHGERGPKGHGVKRAVTTNSMDRRKIRAALEDDPSPHGTTVWKRSKSPPSLRGSRRSTTTRSKSDSLMSGKQTDSTMSASTPARTTSERRRTLSPDPPQDPRDRAASVLAKLEGRRRASTTDSQDSLPRLDAMSASSPANFNTSMRSFHSSVASKFLNYTGTGEYESDDSDEFDLRMSNVMGVSKYHSATKTTGPPVNGLGGKRDSLKKEPSWMGKLSDSLHSLRSMAESAATLGVDDEDHDLDQSDSSEHEIEFEKSLFSNRLRQDLATVDQSVNLMNAEAGEYDWSSRGNKKKVQKNRSMVEMFLSEKTSSSGKTRGHYGCGALCLLVVLILVVCAALLISLMVEFPTSWFDSTSSTDSKAPTPEEGDIVQTKPPTTQLETTRPPPSSLKSPFFEPNVVQQREQTLEALLLKNQPDATTNTVAARKANAWLVAYDPAQLQLEEDASQAVQRYALAVLFFGLHPDVQPSTAPHAVTTTRSSKHKSLSQYHDTENEHRRRLKLHFVDWMTASHVCWWQGVACSDDKEVVTLDLAESRLEGTLPPELGLLESMKELDLSHNRLHKEVPEAWVKLSDLESLKLHDNELSGTVPPDFCQLGQLETFTTDCETTEMECECCSECL